jgi:pimeloyl-ACP methyl ester carboxylesterase
MLGQTSGMAEETMVPAGGVDLCVQTFGEPSAPAVLLIAGAASAMDWWDEEFCRRLAAGGRRVVRYDHRDTGRSTSFTPGAPPYTWPDLAADALALLDSLDVPRAHLVAFGLGGRLAQALATAHPSRVWSLTLIAPAAFAAWPDAEWGDRRVAVDRLVAEVQERAGPFQPDEPRLRRLAQRVFDRSVDMMSSRINHRIVFAEAPAQDGPVTVPTLVLHGTMDRFAAPPPPGARLVRLDGVGHEYPPQAVWPQVLGEILRHTTAAASRPTSLG